MATTEICWLVGWLVGFGWLVGWLVNSVSLALIVSDKL